MKMMIYAGVTFMLDDNRFEVSVRPNGEVYEQQAIKIFRDWIRAREVDPAQQELLEDE